MLFRKIIALFSFLMSFTILYSQESYKVTFDSTHYLLEDMSEVVALYQFSGKSVKYKSETYDIKLPKNFEVADTAFAFIFFQGWEEPMIPQHTLVLIGNYKRSPTVIVDTNHNLDLSDDQVRQLSSLNETLQFKLINSENKDAFCLVEMEKINYKDEEHKNMLEQFILSNASFNKNKAISSAYWLSVKRTNYITTKSVLANDSIYMGLLDGTGNGLFNDIQWDRVMVGNPQSESISAEFSDGGYVLEKNLKIQVNGQSYVVKEVEPSGKFITLEASDVKLTRLKEGDILPDFRFLSMDGKQQTLHNYISNHPYTLLDFWGTWCKPCVANMPKLKEISSKFRQLSIIGLNAHDDDEKAKMFVENNKLNWLNGFATAEILKTLRVDRFPYYVLIQRNGSIIKLDVDLNDIEQILDKN